MFAQDFTHLPVRPLFEDMAVNLRKLAILLGNDQITLPAHDDKLDPINNAVDYIAHHAHAQAVGIMAEFRPFIADKKFPPNDTMKMIVGPLERSILREMALRAENQALKDKLLLK